VAGTTRQVIEQVFREEFGQAVAILIRLLGDFDLAEEAVQEVWSPSESLLLSGPGLLTAQAASARQSFQPVSSGRASSPWSTLPAGKPRRRSPVSSMRCPPIRFRRPGSGCPAVRYPVTWDRRPEGPALGRPLSSVQRPAVRCPPVRCPPVRCPPVRCPPVCCLPPSVRTRPDPPTQAVALGIESSWPGDRDHRNGWRPLGLPESSTARSTVPEAGPRATLAKSRWSLGGR
jgi:hypothetical protein